MTCTEFHGQATATGDRYLASWAMATIRDKAESETQARATIHGGGLGRLEFYFLLRSDGTEVLWGTVVN